MSSDDIIIEKLFEQRDMNLSTLKNLDFELIMEPTEKEIEKIKELQNSTIEEIKKIEQKIAFLTAKKS